MRAPSAANARTIAGRRLAAGEAELSTITEALATREDLPATQFAMTIGEVATKHPSIAAQRIGQRITAMTATAPQHSGALGVIGTMRGLQVEAALTRSSDPDDREQLSLHLRVKDTGKDVIAQSMRLIAGRTLGSSTTSWGQILQ